MKPEVYWTPNARNSFTVCMFMYTGVPHDRHCYNESRDNSMAGTNKDEQDNRQTDHSALNDTSIT